MSPLRHPRSLSTMMALGLALGCPLAASGQSSISNGGGNLSTGSGSGTSPGVGAGASPSSTNTSTARPGSPSQIPRGAPGELTPGQAPGGSSGRSDSFILPGSELPGSMAPLNTTPLNPDESRRVDERLLPEARRITDPSQRSLALERVAREKVLKHVPGDRRLEDAHDALREAAQAAAAMNDWILRDTRLMAIIRNTLTLADEFTRLATNDETYLLDQEAGFAGMTEVDPSLASNTRLTPKMTTRERVDMLRRAEEERSFAADLSQRLDSTNFRAEMLFRVVENESQASQKVSGEVLKVVNPRDYPARLDTEGMEQVDTRGQKVTTPVGRYDLEGSEQALSRMADRGFVLAANVAATISKPVWRDRSMVTIVVNASSADQFARGLEVARHIPHPEYRSDALIRLAESQARRNRAEDATRTYTEAARAVASITLDDPRDILASVLIDSLISVGRFDDARACIGFYSTKDNQLKAMGTVAESQGERRLGQAAFAWIKTEAPPEFRETLQRRVIDGMSRALDRAPKDDLPSGGSRTGSTRR